jgi:(1->4)-alpha-D-glucan 1-alpha-D-glucosylmutase
MAKGVEDTAYYRWTHLVGLCEVGGAPQRFALTPTELLAWASAAQVSTPLGMTTLSTHDTKRGEDTRARLGVLSECADDWSELVDALRATSGPYRSTLLDGRTEYFLWQTLAGTWTADGPIEGSRLEPYLLKAIREAKTRTTWTAPDKPYEDAVIATARRALADPVVLELLTGWEQRTREAVRAATLGAKLVQLTLPGVADVYQGSEVQNPTLVDPDNRRPVALEPLASRLTRLDEGAGPRDLDDEKLLVTSRALRLRRDVPEAFVGPQAGFLPLAHSSGNSMTYARTEEGHARVAVVATRLATTVERLGGWGDHTVALPDGEWHDVLTGADRVGGVRPVAELLERLPVALLVRAGD